MSIVIVIYKFFNGFNTYYCSDNRNFEGEHKVLETDEFEELLKIVKEYPFIRLSW
nr:p6 protein [Cucurbit yellow stunting disorder virus]WIA47367.1 p6 protein [chieh-qua chlorotic virus]WIA47380.1 p6 protein [chieh-qua chlorotic virus]WIA47393.1 p6 protein [chieh-qua chlorotic virus]WIA47406.1 p6 protein [chieh-qua chlorotic virus]